MPVLLGRALVAAVLLFSLGACALPIPTAGAAPPPQPAPVARPATSAITAKDEKLALNATDAFWRRHFSAVFGRAYTSPQIAGGYIGRNGRPCGGQPSVPLNAFYCPHGDFLAWDENLMLRGFEAIGDSWIYLIIAHEWGHAIQARIDRSQVSVAAELQADCFAGATLAGATRDRVITFEPGDAQELSRTLTTVADKFPWTSTSDHGDARQRILSFNNGARGGPLACTV
jgi:predicted metalloprotease